MSILFFGKKDPSAGVFEELLEAHLDGLYNLALRYTRNAAKAEDLVHDTAVRALRFRDQFDLDSNFKAWIYTILTNTFINRYRRQKRERQIMEGATRDDVLVQMQSDTSRDQAQKPESMYLDSMLSDDVSAALDNLSQDLRAVVVLCDLEGMSYRDAADVVQCPVGTVMSRLFRARKALKRKLGAVAQERGIIRGVVDTSVDTDSLPVAASTTRQLRRKQA